MPFRLVFSVECLGDCVLPSFNGDFVRGFFYRVLRGFDEGLARSVHGLSLKPFMVSPLMRGGRWFGFGSVLKVRRGDVFEFYVGLVDDDLLGVVDHFSNVDFLNIGSCRFSVLSVDKRFAGFEELLGGDLFDSVVVEFLTPTQFRVRGKGFPYLFPDLKWVFGSLVRIWNAFAPDSLRFDSDRVLSLVEDYSFVSFYNLRTVFVDFGDYRLPGFLGRMGVRFTSRGDHVRSLGALLRFAEFSGVGRKRTQGFGVVRVEFPEPSEGDYNVIG